MAVVVVVVVHREPPVAVKFVVKLRPSVVKLHPSADLAVVAAVVVVVGVLSTAKIE